MKVARETVNGLLDRFSDLKQRRTTWEPHWQEIRHLVRVNTSDFSFQTTRGQNRHENIYDGTAPWSLEQFAAGLHSHLTNPSIRWFNLEVEGFEATSSPDILAWTEEVSDIIYGAFADPESTFNPALHEAYMDLGAFGTAVLFQDWSMDKGKLSFRSFPLADCYIQENHDGLVDTIFRRTLMSARQIAQKFGQNELPEQMKKEQPDKEWEVIHCVYPREDLPMLKGIKTKYEMPFGSFWFSDECKHIFSESGYNSFPYHVPRWSKLAGEIYGRSPAMTCLPDIKMINQMSKVVIKGAQKAVDPPLMVPDDGFMLPLKTAPSSLIFYQQGTEPIQPLETRARIDIGLDMMEQRRDHIIKSFFVDWLLQQKNRTEMTATEVMDRREEKLRMMAPMIGRLESELLGRIISRSFELLRSNQMIPEPPEMIMGAGLSVSYSSPASTAQMSGKSVAIQKFLEDLVPMAQVDPTVMDKINLDEFVKVMAELRDVTRRIIRPDREVAEMRQGRQEQQMMMQQAEMAEPMAGSIKSLAEAEAIQAGIGNA